MLTKISTKRGVKGGLFYCMWAVDNIITSHIFGKTFKKIHKENQHQQTGGKKSVILKYKWQQKASK